MTFLKKNTTTLFRVFFLLFIVGIIGLLWQQNQRYSAEIKSPGGNLIEGVVGAPRFINPVLAQSQADLDMTRLLFTPMLNINRTGETFYQLIDELEISKDERNYEITLKKDIYFEDGNRMTADDVVFTINSIKDPLIKSPLSAKWQGVRVEKINSSKVVFTLAQPFNDFIYNLEIGILPKHIWENINSQEFIFSNYNTTPVGYGPYKVKKIIKEESGVPSRYLLAKSQSSKERPYIQNLTVDFFSNEEDLVEALGDNKIHAAYGISSKYINDALVKKKVVETGTLPRVFALFFNQEKQPIFKSQRIREAIQYGIDKENLTQDVFNGYANPINSAFGFNSENEFSQEQAISLIQKDGWKLNNDLIYEKKINGKDTLLEFSIAIPNIEDMRSTAENIQNDLSEIGIKVIIRSYDQGNLNQNIMRPREYEALLFGYEIEKPSDMYAFWHSSQISDPGLNMSLFKDSEVDLALNNLRASEEQKLVNLDTLINEKVPAVFLYSPSYIYVLPSSVKGYNLSITKSSDRFNSLSNWYKRTRHVWPLFINKENNS